MVRNLWLVSGQVLGLTACLSLFWACGGDNSGGRDGDDDGGSNSVGGSGGSGGGGAGAATGGSGGSSGGASTCTTAKGTAADTLVYDGATSAGTCPSGIAAPRNGYFFGYHDTVESPNTMRSQLQELNGRGGADDCAYHAKGSGATGYGAGAGFDLNYANNASCPYDASAFMGISVYLKGTTTGTRGANYALTPNSVRLKLVTTDDAGGDDFGTWCTVAETEWTECRVTFAEATREGWNAEYTATALDPTKLLKVQFEFPTHEVEGVKSTVEYDVYIDDVTFF